MLTNEQLRVKKSGPLLVPRYLEARDRARLEPIARELIALMSRSIGERREDAEAALDAVDHRPGDRLIVQGLKKLLLDRTEMATAEGVDPAELRGRVFRVAAERRRQLAPGERFDRARVIDQVAGELELPHAELEERLFADLKSNERVASFEPISAAALLDRYNVALAQGVLLRATRVQIALEGEEPGRVRQLFRAARFHGLLHRVSQLDEHRYLIELDGPFSLFSAVQKYGLKLALFLPAVLRCRRWRLGADVLWGKRKEPARFELGPEAGLVPHQRAIEGVSPEVGQLLEGFAKLDCAWHAEPNEHIFALPGEAVCVPDVVFTNKETGEQVYLEAFGFWSRTAVWNRIETLSTGFPARIILAVGKQLRVSEETLDESGPGEIYVYRTSMRPKAILERLETPR